MKFEIPILKKEDVIEFEEEKYEEEKGKIFVVHEHDATHLHYDLRLEIRGVLKSWAIPKELPAEMGIKRLAIKVADHDIKYADFEGIIPQGMYGAGTVKIWDSGKFILEEEKYNKLLFELKGKKLIGKYALIKMGYQKNWLFFKREL